MGRKSGWPVGVSSCLSSCIYTGFLIEVLIGGVLKHEYVMCFNYELMGVSTNYGAMKFV